MLGEKTVPVHLCASQILYGQLWGWTWHCRGKLWSMTKSQVTTKSVLSCSLSACICSSYSLTCLFVISIFIVWLEGVVWDIIQPNHWLVGIFHNEIFSIFLFHADIHNTAEDSPCIIHIQCYLRCKLIWLILLCTQDHVFGWVSDMSTWHIPRIRIK